MTPQIIFETLKVSVATATRHWASQHYLQGTIQGRNIKKRLSVAWTAQVLIVQKEIDRLDVILPLSKVSFIQMCLPSTDVNK